MSNGILRRAILGFLTLLCIGAPLGASAQAYPNKPIRLLVGFAPGGGTDVLARLVAQHLSERMGQPVVVENRPGANTIIVTDLTAKSAPDGYTLAMAATPNVTNQSLYSRLPYDAAKDFTWISQLTVSSLVLLANPTVRATTLKEVIALAKAEPRRLSYGSAGAGGSVHLAGVMLEKMADVNMIHVGYKGSGPAFTDLIGGQLNFLFADIPQVAEHIKAGRVRAIAVTTQKRSPALPNVPTLAEEGLAGYEVPVWYGVFGPAGMPPAVVSRLARELKEVLAVPAVKERLASWGVEPVGSTPAEFDAFIKSESAKWSQIIKQANIRLD